ncbi:MAG: hypothetical protein IJA32_15195 [Lachnospiraceae bacterium]|nr:hypothetical protein [Lachnospiraceae bacterium]
MKDEKDTKEMYHMQEKKKKQEDYMLVAIACLVMATLLTVGEIYFWKEFSVLEHITSAVVILFFVLGGIVLIYGAKFEKKTEVEKYTIDNELRHKMREAYCKERQKLRRKNDDMFHTVYRYSVLKTIPVSLLFLLLLLILWEVCFENYDYGPESRLFLYGVGAFVGIYYVLQIAYLLFGGHVKKLKKYIIRNGYDMEELNQDYKNGEIYSVRSGVLNIGWKYTVYINYGDKKQSFVLLNNQIICAEKRLRNKKTPTGEKEDMDTMLFYIRIYTKQEIFEILSGDIAGDMILEGFQLHGIEIKMIDERE